jgi:hypothetical protein
MQGLTAERGRARERRRRHIRRRRLVAFVVVSILVLLAIWAASSIPSATPARVPSQGAVATFGASTGVERRIVVAQIDGIDLLLPVRQEYTTAIAYHSAGVPNGVAMTPAGEHVGGGSLISRLADVFKSGGDVKYYIMGGGTSPTAGLDIGATPGVTVSSPVNGRVSAVKTYSLLGRYTDYEIDIELAGDSSVILAVTHVAGPAVKIGDQVVAGETALGVVRGFPAALKQSLSHYTSDNGDHVEIVALRVNVQPAGL